MIEYNLVIYNNYPCFRDKPKAKSPKGGKQHEQVRISIGC